MFLAAISIQNLASMFQAMYDGIGLAQTDASDLAPYLADSVFHWKEPVNIGAEIVNWIGAAITIIPMFAIKEAIGPVPRIGLGGLSTFSTTAGEQATGSLQLDPDLNRNSGIDELLTDIQNFSSTARSAIEQWADSVFAGQPDLRGRTILDYLQDGSFIDQSVVPTVTQVESFYKSAMVARAVNGLWRAESAYLIGTTAELNQSEYPANSSYTSRSTNVTYIPYYFDGKAQQQLPGMQVLSGGTIGLNASHVAEASARAWEVAAFNYTPQLAFRRLEASFSSNGELTPFQDGDRWEGTYTLPVCDVGPHKEWVVQYGGRMVPCCCGPNCTETRAFIAASNLNTSGNFLHMCRKELKGTSLDFSKIDYGIHPRGLSKGQKAGVAIGVLLFVVMVALVVAIIVTRVRDRKEREWRRSINTGARPSTPPPRYEFSSNPSPPSQPSTNNVACSTLAGATAGVFTGLAAGTFLGLAGVVAVPAAAAMWIGGSVGAAFGFSQATN